MTAALFWQLTNSSPRFSVGCTRRVYRWAESARGALMQKQLVAEGAEKPETCFQTKKKKTAEGCGFFC